jgi:hypothetical protein
VDAGVNVNSGYGVWGEKREMEMGGPGEGCSVEKKIEVKWWGCGF